MAMLTVRQQKWAIRLVALLFVILCANTLRRMAETPEIHRKILGGLVTSLVLNAGLLLSSFSHRNWIRYSLGVLLIPSALGVAFVLTDYHLIMSALSIVFHVWLISWLFTRRVTDENSPNIAR